ncbi:response regulator [Azospirillum soli]|uniref:response regulator n=1 Tax=Azospirillum soli TaxID=1304799 RepID=UPI001AE566F3|nr:response regulator [Azospirillum soli]MBP2314647.1 CheY-like chemotaxis protein [Azospirillum soli]
MPASGSGNIVQPAHAPCRVLIVEDEQLVALSLSCMIEDLEHEVCAVADSGAKAIEAATLHHPSLALVDLRIKGSMDGIDTARTLRGMGIPSIILSGDGNPDTLARAKDAGAVGFVMKPYSLDELRVALGKAVGHG